MLPIIGCPFGGNVTCYLFDTGCPLGGGSFCCGVVLGMYSCLPW